MEFISVGWMKFIYDDQHLIQLQRNENWLPRAYLMRIPARRVSFPVAVTVIDYRLGHQVPDDAKTGSSATEKQ
jgi:hypothetical protein